MADEAQAGSDQLQRPAAPPGRARSCARYERGAQFGRLPRHRPQLLDRRVRDGIRYRYTIRVADAAGNVAEATVGASPRPPLYRPAQGALVRAPIAFAWEAVEGVGFYNFQLLRTREGAQRLATRRRPQSRLELALRREALPARARRLPLVRLGARRQPGATGFGDRLGSSTFVVKGPEGCRR